MSQTAQGVKMNQKKALVTGASSGIGFVFAGELAKDGYGVTCVARSEDKLQNLVQALGEGHRLISADLSDPAQLKKIEQELSDTKYDLLVRGGTLVDPVAGIHAPRDIAFAGGVVAAIENEIPAAEVM